MANGVDFSYRVTLHQCLQRLLRKVILAKDKSCQHTMLNRVYAWYYQKLEAIGAMSASEKQEEEMFMNPGKIDEIQRKIED